MSSAPDRSQLRILVLSASGRADSLNGRLAALAAASIESAGSIADLATLRDFAMPGYDGDEEQAEGIPAGAHALRDRLIASDAYVIASPEYNAAMPGGLKNAVDWVSRFRPQPFHERHALLLSASPSMVGGNRGLWSLRVPLEHLGSRVYPDMFSLAQAHTMFAEDGSLTVAALQDRFDATIGSFLALVEAAKNYSCLRSRWIEFLGESPTPLTDRAE